MHSIKTRRKLQSGLLAILIFAVAAGCAKNPVTGERELALISEQQEIQIGRDAHPEVLGQFGEVRNEALQAYFRDVGLRLAAISHRPDLPWSFTVVDDSLVNAFALPGGFIYFTRGILAYMNNEAEMAGVLGHEIGHVTARHSVSQVSKAQLVSTGLGLGSIFSPAVYKFGGLAEVGFGLLFLKYGREDESQSDELGVRYMYQLGYDPRELSDFFHVFERMREGDGEGPPTWLSSHPAPPDRVRKTAELAEQLLAQSGEQRELTVGSARFLEKIDGLVFGENPREGFTREGRFLHPDLEFQIAYPASWNVQNTKAKVVFVHPEGRVGVQLTVAPPETRSPRARAEQIAAQPDTALVAGRDTSIHGIPGFIAEFRIRDSSGRTLRAIAAFLSFNGRIFEVVGLGSASDVQRHYRELEAVITSFDRLRDGSALQVQPDRLALYQIQRGGTIADVARLFPNPRISVEELALLNRIESNQPLEAGRIVKIVKAGS